MAEALLAAAPERFTLIGLSLGGYLAFEVMRRAPARVERLALLDTTAAADSETRRAGRLADIATVEAGGIDALIPQLPGRWLLPAHQQRDDLTALMASMARSIGAKGRRTSSGRCSAGPSRSPTSPPCACRRSSCAAPATRSRRLPITRRSPRASPARASSSFPRAATCRRSSSRGGDRRTLDWLADTSAPAGVAR
jgi:pimeloyl-ACP methyl ester carboxylesterase